MDPPVSLGYHSRDVTAGIDPAGDPGGDRTSRCEIHLPLPASSSSPRGCDAGGFGEAGSPLPCGSCGCPPAASQPGSQSLCATSVRLCETRHREQKKAGMLAWKLTRFRVSFQMERQISSIRTPRTLPAAAPARSQTSDPCPALHITPELWRVRAGTTKPEMFRGRQRLESSSRLRSRSVTSWDPAVQLRSILLG